MSVNFQLVGAGVDVGPVIADLAAAPELWGEIDCRATWEGSPHRDMVDIYVRYGSDPRNSDAHIPEFYPSYAKLQSLRPILFGLMHLVEGESLGLVLITKLAPGGKILPHVDRGWHGGHYSKFYVPLQCEPGAIFGFEDGDMQAKPGEIWAFRNDRPHWVNNDSAVDRVGMIVSIRTRLFPEGTTLE